MMEGWKTDKFKNQIQYKSGYTWSKEQELKTQEPNSVRVLTVTNIQKDLDLSEELYLQGVNEKDKKEKAVSKDWCIAVSSNGNRKRIGNAVFIKDDTDYLFASFLTAFKPKDNSDILPDYFFRWLTSHNVQERITSVSEGTTGLGNLDIRYLRNMDIHFPEKQEQTAIAAMLSKVDEAIAAVQGSIAAAERLKKSLMQNLLTGRIKPDGTLRKEDEFYVDEKFGRVPVGWEVKRLKDICLNSGDYGANASAIDYDETKPRFIRITDIDDFGQLLEEGKAGMSGDNYSKYLLKEDDFLFARTGDTVGKSLLYKKEMGFAVYAGYLIKFSFDKSKVLPEYFDLIAKSEFFEAFKIAMKRVGAKPNINSREYCSFKFLLPSDTKEQKEIYGKFANIIKSQKSKQQKIAVLERLKKSLMQNLLTGKVRINNLI